MFSQKIAFPLPLSIPFLFPHNYRSTEYKDFVEPGLRFIENTQCKVYADGELNVF